MSMRARTSCRKRGDTSIVVQPFPRNPKALHKSNWATAGGAIMLQVKPSKNRIFWESVTKRIFIGPWIVFGIVGYIASIASLITLIRLGFKVGLGRPFALIIDQYDKLVHNLIGTWAEPLIFVCLKNIEKTLGFSLQLQPSWKHVLVLMWLYFGAGLKVDKEDRGLGTVLFTIIWGGAIALVSSVVFGVVPPSNSALQVLLVVIPVAGVVLYELGRRAWTALFFPLQGCGWVDTFIDGCITYVLPVAIIGFSVVAGGLAASEMGVAIGDPASGLPLLFGFVVLLAFYWFGRGVMRATFDRQQDERWRQRFHRSGSARIGVYMLATLLGIAIFLIANAGLS